jgi:hypothetical protein
MALVVSVFAISISSIFQSLQLTVSDSNALLVPAIDDLSVLPVVNRNESITEAKVRSSVVQPVKPDAPPGNATTVIRVAAINESGKVLDTARDHTPKEHPLMTSPTNVEGRLFGNFSNNLARGANIMTSISGCHIAAWIYYESPTRRTPDCGDRRTSKQQLWSHKGELGPLPDDLQAFDTLFVHKRMVQAFVENTLPYLQTPIVLLTGSYENSKRFRVDTNHTQQLLESPMIVHWFCTNIYETLGMKSLPPKLHSMALGVEPFGKDPKRHPIPVALIRDTLLRYASENNWSTLPNKTIGVFEAYTSPFTNPNRKNMPRGVKMPLPDYLDQMARSKFVISPNGHKPDCFRHYEALSVGAIPITELDPSLYSHLEAGPVIFNNLHWWNITETQALRLLNVTEFPPVNRNLIFEEYWMEDMEATVGQPLRWYDIRRKQRSKLKYFEFHFDEVPLLIKSAWADYSPNSTVMLQNYIGERSLRRKKWALDLMKGNSINPPPSSGEVPQALVPSLGIQRFNNFTTNLARGANLMTSISGCHIASWIYMVGNKKRNQDCGDSRSNPTQALDLRSDSFPQIEAYDTIYVHLRMVKDFVTNFLPLLNVPVILLSGSYDNTLNSRVPYSIVEKIVESPRIEYWFCQNAKNSTGLPFLPPKVHPMALGIEPFGKNPGAHPNPVVIIRDALLRYALNLPNKTIGVFEAYTSPYTNPNRQNMPRGIKMPLPDYLEYLAKSKFVLSPSGHKPDCFRHYEALAFGAIPITDLDPLFYNHLKAGPVIYQNTEWWNLTEAQSLKLLDVAGFPAVNRNLIFEEYWMEEMERIVGRPLRWFDVRQHKRSLLDSFYLNFDDVPKIIDSAWADFSNDSAVTTKRFIGEKKAWKQKQWPPDDIPSKRS